MHGADVFKSTAGDIDAEVGRNPPNQVSAAARTAESDVTFLQVGNVMEITICESKYTVHKDLSPWVSFPGNMQHWKQQGFILGLHA